LYSQLFLWVTNSVNITIFAWRAPGTHSPGKSVLTDGFPTAFQTNQHLNALAKTLTNTLTRWRKRWPGPCDCAEDPPDLEFYRFRAFTLGKSGRIAAHALNYVPSPHAVVYSPGCVPPSTATFFRVSSFAPSTILFIFYVYWKEKYYYICTLLLY
jgi:hypothetical protein